MQKVFRDNNISDLTQVITTKKFKNIFLVRIRNSYEPSGAKKFIENNFNVSMSFYNFNTNPQLDDLTKGINLFKESNYDCIIAIGGGSTIDMAKLISVFAHQENCIESYLSGENTINNQKTPLIAIPTTAGTGAETTAFSVLYVDKTKYSVASKTMLPDYVYLSHRFSLSANSYLTACTGADAFCQAIESVWSVNSTPESEKYAYKTVHLIWNNLKDAVIHNSADAKRIIQEAAFLAGKAINISKTSAPHAISYAFTSYYHIPHGHAVSISLPYFFEFNCNISNDDCIDKRGSNAVIEKLNKLLQIIRLDKTNVKQELTSFFAFIGIETNISVLINNFDTSLIIDNVNIQRLKNNPREIKHDDLLDFVEKDRRE